MAASNFRRENLSRVQAHTSELIAHVTGLRRGDENFRIAEDFILSNLQNNVYQDTNENDVRRSIEALEAKFHVHNQSERAARFKYLVDSFKKKPMRQEGISDAHMSMVHLLFLLSSNPVGQDGYIDEEIRGSIGTKTYLTREQAAEQHTEYVEDQIRKIQEEEPKEEEDLESSLDGDDGFSSEDVDEEDQDATAGARRRQASPLRALR